MGVCSQGQSYCEKPVSGYLMSWYKQSSQDATWQTAITYYLTEHNACECPTSKLRQSPYIPLVKQRVTLINKNDLCMFKSSDKQTKTQCVCINVQENWREKSIPIIFSSLVLFPLVNICFVLGTVPLNLFRK